MNVKWKIILLVLLINTGTCFLFLSLFQTHLQRDLDHTINRDIENVRALSSAAERTLAGRYQKRIASFVNMTKMPERQPMIQAFADQNRSALVKYTTQYLCLLKGESPYFSTIAWVNSDNKMFLRTLNHQAYGDDISNMRPDFVQVNREQKPISGFMVAKTGLEYRVIQPVFYQDKFIGSVQFGITANFLLDAIQTQLHLPVGIAVPNSRYQFIKKNKEGFQDTGTYHVFFPNIVDPNQIRSLIDWTLDRQEITHKGKNFILVRTLELVDFQQQEQGAIYVLLDISDYYAHMRTSTMIILLFSGCAILMTFILIYVSYGKMQSYVEVLNNKLNRQNDVLEQTVKERTQALQHSEDRFKKLSRVTFEGIVIHQVGLVLDVNESLTKMFGYTGQEIIGSNGAELFFPSESYQVLRENIAKRIAIPYEVMARKKDGTLFPTEIESRNIVEGDECFRVTAIRDITARKKAEQDRLELEIQLRQKFKMEAVGTMAGGIAHNFNNNLSIILGNVELSQLKANDPEISGLLSNAKIAVMRSRDLVSQIMTYSRTGSHAKAPLQLPIIIDETLKLLGATMPSTIQLNQTISPDSYHTTINANASQIQEILLNLYGNALHAMNEEGELNINLDVVELTDRDLPDLKQNKPGRYAKISIQDSGCGMAPETQEKIFDPFFTTKEMYEGTGMGLATVQGIINQHEGLIKVISTLGEGTTFELYFPVIEQVQTVEATPNNTELVGGTEKILFIDDDEMLASLGEMMLCEMGYQVTMMTDSQEALKLFAANAERFDLVITDQTMPKLTGKELIQKLKQIRPDIQTIICTGYSSKVDAAAAQKLGADAFLMKPLDLPVLLQTISRVLGGEKG